MRLTLGNLLITSPPVRLWTRTSYASCDDVDSEFTAGFERFAPDRLESFSLPGSTTGKVMKVEVLDGDFLNGGWRAEALGVTEGAGQPTISYKWLTMIDPAHVVEPHLVRDPTLRPFQVITQWHHSLPTASSSGSPPIALILDHGNILLDIYDPPGTVHKGRWVVASIDRGHWHTFEAEIFWSTTDGTLKLWHDGNAVMFDPQVPNDNPGASPYPTQRTDTLTGLKNLYPATPTAYFKIGLYRNAEKAVPDGPYRLYHDEVARFEPMSVRGTPLLAASVVGALIAGAILRQVRGVLHRSR